MISKRSIGISASEERLNKLLTERLQPGADKEQIDRRIWDLFGENWAVMFTDLSGFSRGVDKFGIIHFLQIIKESERLFIPIIEENDGVLLKMEGDSMLVIFRNVKKAINCAISMQRICKIYNNNKTDEEKILLAAGLGYGVLLRIGDDDVFGAEVNASSKLGEDIGEPWEILITQGVKDNLSDFDGITFEPIDKVPSGAKKAYRVKYKL